MTGPADTPSVRDERFHKAALVALAGVYVFAFAGPWSTSLVDFGMFMILAGSLPFLPELWKDLRREPIFWAIIALLLYLIVHTVIHLHWYPELDSMKNPHWSHWFRTAGLWSLILGWWLYRRPDHIKPVVLTLVAGLIMGTLYKGDHMSLLSSETWSRSVWGYSPNYLGMASGFALLTLIVWLAHGRRGLLNPWEWLATGSLLILFTLMFISSGSRTAWVAFPFGLAVILLYGVLDQTRMSSLKPIYIALGLMFLVLVIVLIAQPDYLDARLGRDREALTKVLALEWADAADVRTPFGYRLAIWFRGVEAFVEQPLAGWGSGSGSLVVHSDDLDFRHFHNIYMEVLVSFGLIGALLFAWIHFLLYARTIDAARSGGISRTMLIALAAITVFFLIKMTNEIRIGQSEGRALITTLYAFYAYAMFRGGGRVHD